MPGRMTAERRSTPYRPRRRACPFASSELRLPPEPRYIRVKAGRTVGVLPGAAARTGITWAWQGSDVEGGSLRSLRGQLRWTSHDFRALIRLSGRESVSGYGPVPAPSRRRRERRRVRP
ncbi:hypothetical protein GCM10010271_00060 [Streptomyces kurssanovii]|nr:hypothetical protein GCM10010271_00060 [Streptomyces kurssanovii]